MHFLYTPLVPVAGMAYFVSSMVLGIYKTGVEAVCLCYVKDKSYNTGSDEKPFQMTEEVFVVMNMHLKPVEAKEREKRGKIRKEQRRRAAYLSQALLRH